MPLVIARFYFWNSGSVAQMSQMGLLRSILHDILRKMPHLVQAAFPQRWRIARLLGQDTRSWTLSELMKAFKTVLKCCESSFKLCMFIDGLDEFDGSHERLVNLFKEVVSCPNVNACLSSRPWVIFEDAFSQKANLQLHELTYPDIQRFTHSLFNANSHFLHMKRRDPDRCSTLIEAVATRAAGVFLWVDLAVRSLLSGLSNRDRTSDLQRRLDEIPPDLEKFYEKMFEGIEAFYFEHACQLLQIVGEAKGRLTVLELSFADEENFEALLAEPPAPLNSEEKGERYQAIKRRLISRCKGFLEIPVHTMPSCVAQSQQQEDGTQIAAAEAFISQWREEMGPTQEVGSNTNGITQNQVVGSSLTSPSDVKVSYLHRTARDFLHSPEMKKQIQAGVKESFCPFLSLFRSSILCLNTFEGPLNDSHQPKLWRHIEDSLEYAAECEAWSGIPQTRLLQKVDEIVTYVSTNEVPAFRGEQDSALAREDNYHWTTTRRNDTGAGGFVDLAAKYNMPLYIMQTIKSALKDAAPDDPDIHTCLFHVVRDYKAHAGLCEWVGSRVPRLSFIQFLLSRGADPNKYYNSVTPFEVVLSEAVEASHDAATTEKKRTLEHWALVIEDFIKHNGNPKANRNSIMGSRIREAFSHFLPEGARQLEQMMKRSGNRWSATRKFLVPPLIGASLSTEIDRMPIRMFNKMQSVSISAGGHPTPERAIGGESQQRLNYWEKPQPQFRHPEEIRANSRKLFVARGGSTSFTNETEVESEFRGTYWPRRGDLVPGDPDWPGPPFPGLGLVRQGRQRGQAQDDRLSALSPPPQSTPNSIGRHDEFSTHTSRRRIHRQPGVSSLRAERENEPDAEPRPRRGRKFEPRLT